MEGTYETVFFMFQKCLVFFKRNGTLSQRYFLQKHYCKVMVEKNIKLNNLYPATILLQKY